ncbi:MAG: short-chain dehydrogenase [Magnetovibrio sp.]|nr:short-chain dehydrogenase [Magnetovibrio sp.]
MDNSEAPLNGKVAVITGAARNIGRATAKRLASYGASVVVNAVQDREAADAVAHEIFESGGKALAHIADVTNEDAVNTMMETGAKAFRSVDILICNASVRAQKSFQEITVEEWHHTIAVTLNGAFFCARAVAPFMIENRWGRIIGLGGMSSNLGMAKRLHVLAAKAGLVGIMRGLATELAPHNVTCNIVAPGHIETDRPKSAGPRPSAGMSPPINRLGVVEEIAGMIHYLCLPEADYITGQTMHVNGGVYYGV